VPVPEDGKYEDKTCIERKVFITVVEAPVDVENIVRVAVGKRQLIVPF
jgi:hypothetical protein